MHLAHVMTLLATVTAASAICAGIAGGVYFAFSTMVMPALRSAPANRAIAVMQLVNVNAVRPPFMLVFFGGAAAALAVLISEISAGTDTPASTSRAVGAGLALAAFGITVVRNVPLNNALARVTVDASDAAAQWNRFSRAWRVANHARAAAAIAATILLATPLEGSA